MVRVRRVVVSILFVLFSLTAYAADNPPPKNLHLVGDHWTPYDPPDPSTYPPEAKVHIIVPGDTLWALAGTYYSNPYLWPQLWEANTYITDAHWIYPGDPLLVNGEVTTADVGSTTGVGAGEGGTDQAASGDVPAMTAQMVPEDEEIGVPIALGTTADIYCFGYLGMVDEPLPNRVVSFEDVGVKWNFNAKYQLTGVATDDIIYIDGGTSTGLVAGEVYLVVKPKEIIKHPQTKDTIGRHYDFRGQVKILCATENSATGIIVQACDDIHVGDSLRAMPQLPIPISRLTPMATVCSPPSGKTQGFVVNAKDTKYTLGVGSLVEINLGKDDFVQPGDFLTVFRDNPVAGFPSQILGEIGVLTAEAHTATAMVVRMRYGMMVGDRVELK